MQTVCTHPDSSNQLRKSHIMQYHCGYYKLVYFLGYTEITLQLLWQELPHMQ